MRRRPIIKIIESLDELSNKKLSECLVTSQSQIILLPTATHLPYLKKEEEEEGDGGKTVNAQFLDEV